MLLFRRAQHTVPSVSSNTRYGRFTIQARSRYNMSKHRVHLGTDRVYGASGSDMRG